MINVLYSFERGSELEYNWISNHSKTYSWALVTTRFPTFIHTGWVHLGSPKLSSPSFETPFMKSRRPAKEIFSTMVLFTTGLLAFSCRVFAQFLSTLKYTFSSSYGKLFFVISAATIYVFRERTVIYLELFWYKFLQIKNGRNCSISYRISS